MLKGFSNGEMLFIALVVLIIVYLAFLLMSFPGTPEIYLGRSYPIGLVAYVMEGDTLKLSMANNAGESIVINTVTINGTRFVQNKPLYLSNKGVMTSQQLRGQYCQGGTPYAYMIEFEYTMGGEKGIQTYEVPVAGKCRDI